MPRKTPGATAVPRKDRSNDFAIRASLTRVLLAAGVDRSKIRHEIPLSGHSGNGRADMVLLAPSLNELVGIELKSGKDKLDRLETQHVAYGACFDRMIVAHDPRHVEGMGALPYWGNWTSVSVRCPAPDGDRERDRIVWDCIHPRYRGGTSWHLRPGAMAEMLWAVEVDETLAALKLPSRDTRHAGVGVLIEQACIADLRAQILLRLKARQLNRWEEAFWKAFDAAPGPISASAVVAQAGALAA